MVQFLKRLSYQERDITILQNMKNAKTQLNPQTAFGLISYTEEVIKRPKLTCGFSCVEWSLVWQESSQRIFHRSAESISFNWINFNWFFIIIINRLYDFKLGFISSKFPAIAVQHSFTISTKRSLSISSNALQARTFPTIHSPSRPVSCQIAENEIRNFIIFELILRWIIWQNQIQLSGLRVSRVNTLD